MRKNRVRLTESGLRRIVSESVKRILNEIEVKPKLDDKYGTRKYLDDTFGEYNGKMPKDWITTDTLVKTNNREPEIGLKRIPKRDVNGYDREGYDREGYDKNGFGRSGFDKEGFNNRGYDREGYNREGFNRYGIDRDGFNRQGFNKNGLNRDNVDRNGYKKGNSSWRSIIKQCFDDELNQDLLHILDISVYGNDYEKKSIKGEISQLLNRIEGKILNEYVPNDSDKIRLRKFIRREISDELERRCSDYLDTSDEREYW